MAVTRRRHNVSLWNEDTNVKKKFSLCNNPLTGCLLLPDMADLTVPLGSIIIPCLTLGGSLAMLTPYGTEE